MITADASPTMIGMSDQEDDRILGLLQAGPATIARLAARLGMAQGVVSYHLTVLNQAGRVQVATSRRVRGVLERTYARVGSASAPSPAFFSPSSAFSPSPAFEPTAAFSPSPASTTASTTASPSAEVFPAAGFYSAPVSAPRLRDVRQVAVDDSTFYEFAERLSTLADEFSARRTPGAPVAELSIALYRPATDGATNGYGS
jgi:hypothetical protein